MVCRNRYRQKVLLSAALLLVLGSSSLLGGMAELGRTRNLLPAPEAAGTDGAMGGGTVVLSVEGQLFSVNTTGTDTVDTILDALKNQVNMVGVGLVANHVPGSFEITVTRSDMSEVASLAIRNTDTGFGYVQSTRSRGGIASVAGFTVAPTGLGSATIFVDNAIAATTSTSAFTGDAAALNQELLSQLLAGGCDASLDENGVFTLFRNSAGQRITSVGWEDTDFLDADGVRSLIVAKNQDAPGLPSATTWGLVLLTLLLLSALTAFSLRRRRRAA